MITRAALRITILVALGAGLSTMVAVLGPAAAQPAGQPAPPPAAQPAPQPPVPSSARRLRIAAFEGGHNLALWAAVRQGFFEDNGVTVITTYVPSSTAMVTGVADVKFDIAFLAMDNVIAYKEGQGEARLMTPPDMFAFLGIDDGLVTLEVAPAVKRMADLKGKTLSVDAMTTGYAFVLRELIARAGLQDPDVHLVSAGGTANRYRELIAGKHDGTLLRTPFELLARDKGFRALATTDGLGPYLGTVAAARRQWARDNEAAMIGFIRGYRAGLAWVSDPRNRAIAEALLIANIRDMTPALAKRSYDVLFAARSGLLRDLSLDPARIQTVLGLRSKFGEPKKVLNNPTTYIDTSYRDKALEKPAPSAH
jgi:ABC-type nitrate/sulfonate/bicarbonate transport system substrate-binding protein